MNFWPDYQIAEEAEDEAAAAAVAKGMAKVSVGTFLVALGGLIILPLFHNQFFSGPLINAVLLIITMMLGLRAGVILSFVPSIMALLAGLLPALLMPFLPFIMAGNILLVVIFHYLRQKNYWLGAGLGAIVKFAFLTAAIQIFFRFFINKPVVQAIAYMMSWNQLYSALLGAVIAFAFLKFIKRI